MADIRSKKKPVIQKGEGYVYNPATFYQEHHVEFFHEATDPQELLSVIKPLEFMGGRYIFFDTETHPYFASSHDLPPNVVRRWVDTGKKAKPQDFPFSMQFCGDSDAYIIHDSVDNGFRLFKQLAPLFLDPTITFVIHNAKFDMHMTQNVGMKIVGRIIDTVVLAKLVNENRPDFTLLGLASRTKDGIVKFEHMLETYKQLNHVTDYRQIPRPLINEYGCADVWNAKCVFIKEYTSMIEQDKTSKPRQRLQDVFNNETELTVALYAMERRGMRTDKAYEPDLKTSLQKSCDAAEQSVYDYAGEIFNINSTQQVARIMKKLGVDESILHYTDKGNVKLDKDEMERLDELYHIPIISKIQEFKKLDKLLTTYATGIYDQVDSVGNAHGSINQTEAITGRMSITKPALQTLPKKDKRIRRMFIPENNYNMWFLDLDQVEYRGFAHYAKASGLIEAINNGYDVHAATAAMVFHIPLEELADNIHKHTVAENDKKALMTALKKAEEAGEDLTVYTSKIDDLDVIIIDLQQFVDMRGKGKTANFALVYGVGNEHLSEILRCSLTKATDFRATYFANIPEAKVFINTVYAVIKERGYITNFYGRRRRLDVDECYKAPNSLIQGWAADYIKTKLVNTYKYIQYNHLKTFLSNIVHDELIENVHETELEQVPTLRWLLSDFTNFRCKITAGIEYGDPSWGQKKEPVDDIGFKEPEDKGYLQYNLFDGHVFDINMKEDK